MQAFTCARAWEWGYLHIGLPSHKSKTSYPSLVKHLNEGKHMIRETLLRVIVCIKGLACKWKGGWTYFKHFKIVISLFVYHGHIFMQLAMALHHLPSPCLTMMDASGFHGLHVPNCLCVVWQQVLSMWHLFVADCMFEACDLAQLEAPRGSRALTLAPCDLAQLEVPRGSRALTLHTLYFFICVVSTVGTCNSQMFEPCVYTYQ